MHIERFVCAVLIGFALVLVPFIGTCIIYVGILVCCLLS